MMSMSTSMSSTSMSLIATKATPLRVCARAAAPPRNSIMMIRCEEKDEESKIGARIRVKVPLKVYHVPKVPEIDLAGMEGNIKQNVALWKGKRISANLPYKVEFISKDIQGPRGPLKFSAHLKDDEFEFL
ncbi:ferredoxin-thioredoxin reductase, variable chain [Cicer arietinum]|uniref:Ferredoxin-thioredoxin reductase, variable chain n=1 Tax=Cicer arietinum TaxID=3827 RepID=A0A1S2XJJ9_CICAR|nr:ferredoxin-thioredoxin reductase, variable chain [Cicer arietinum]